MPQSGHDDLFKKRVVFIKKFHTSDNEVITANIQMKYTSALFIE